MNQSAATVVDRVTLHDTEVDPGIARLRLQHTLAGADLRPRGLPAAAWLYVRSLSDPLPRALALSIGQPSPVWERTCRAALERTLARAVRPAREHVPPGAEAVWFADQAELLACLARDALDGVAWTRWWWRRLRAVAPRGEDFVLRAWLGGPQHVPAALELLLTGGSGTMAPFVASLPADGSRSITERVSRAFLATRLADIVSSPRDAPIAPGRKSRDIPAAAPWRELVPEAAGSSELPLDAELLLGVALALRRAPLLARSNAFAVRVQRWLRAVHGPTSVGPEHAATVLGAVAPAPEPAEVRSPQDPDPTAHPGTAADPRVPPGIWHGDTTDARAAVRQVSSGQRHESHDEELESVPALPARSGLWFPSASPSGEDAAPMPPAAPSCPSPLPGRVGPVRGPSRPAALLAAMEPSEPAPVAASEPAARSRRPVARRRSRSAAVPAPAIIAEPGPSAIETELGGTFYLLNLAIALGLYGDFTTPLKSGIALDPWDYVALLGRALTGPSIRRDPLWTLLARLAGRDPRTSPGSGFRAPNAWRTPRAWLEPFDSGGGWQWSAAGGTLRIIHPVGFPAVAVPRRDAHAADQLSRELARLPLSRVPSLQRSALRPEPKLPLARWTGRMAAYSEARLRLALGAAAGASLVDLLLVAHARVLITHTHVEVVLRLDELPLPVRFAGLDRTPGWLPAAGRFISLEFE